MNGYLKNKNFIPESFVEKTERKNHNIEKKLLVLFLGINLIYLPFNINGMINNKTNKVEKISEESYSKKEGFDYEKVCNTIRILLSDDVKECNVNNGNGIIVVHDIDKAENINDKGNINVSDLSLKDDGTFELRVNAYEKDNN